MGVTQRTGPLWEAIQLALEGVPTEEFLTKAKEAKEDITDKLYDLWRETNILDNLVARIAPNEEWSVGVKERPTETSSIRPQTAPPTKTPADRQRRILELADDFTSGAATIVLSSEIAEQLSVENFPGEPRDLAVSVGNVLNRSGNWKRAEAGKYERVTS